jgi:agarase
MWLALVALVSCAVPARAADDYDAYGGWRKIEGQKTGYFHTQQIDGRWWLVTPEGNVFFSKGVDNVNFAPESDHSPAPPADPAAWARATSRQLREWNFNTAGAWSTNQLFTTGIAYAPIVSMAAAVQRDVWLKGGVVDFFSSEFRDAADRSAERMCAPRAKDPWLLGYFTDNELRWGTDWRSGESLLEGYLKMPEASAGFRKASEFMKARGGAVPSAEDAAAFLELVAAEYGRVARDAIRRHDPNHLILGCRFANYPGDTVMKGVGPYFDVVSFHSYAANAPIERLRQITELTGKPAMVTEFSFKAMDSGLPNTKGAARPVATQEDRANGFAGYVEALAALPSCVGYHWFEYRDQPKEGRRLDGENSNYGLVRIDFTPWDVLTRRMKKVNAEVEAAHAAAPAR